MALVLAVMMVLGLVGTALADDTYTITMKTTSGHTYTAYQVFKGDLDGSTLSNIDWGKDVNGTALLTALQGDSTYGTAFADCETERDVAEVLETYTGKSADVEAIAKIIENHVSGGTEGTTSIASLAAGYYLIKDTTAEASMPDGGTYSKFMLEVVKDVEVTAKDSTVTSEKKVKDINDSEEDATYTDWQDSADYDVGDKIPFQLKATIASDYDKYESYTLIFHDEESEGLTFDSTSVEVYVNGTKITSGYEVVTDDIEDDCAFEVAGFHREVQRRSVLLRFLQSS